MSYAACWKWRNPLESELGKSRLPFLGDCDADALLPQPGRRVKAHHRLCDELVVAKGTRRTLVLPTAKYPELLEYTSEAWSARPPARGYRNDSGDAHFPGDPTKSY
ncbi:MAG TPA: hypothetical protein DCE44_20215 [Verrucomicrobiales bacterium]|nr:hypothetical protein [Verrucomicrobiales bacterium]